MLVTTAIRTARMAGDRSRAGLRTQHGPASKPARGAVTPGARNSAGISREVSFRDPHPATGYSLGSWLPLMRLSLREVAQK